MDAFDIYIEYAPDRGETTQKWLAITTDRYIFYAAYSFIYKYKKLVNVVRPTVSGTKVFAYDTANTRYQAQIEKLSNALEKGDKIF